MPRRKQRRNWPGEETEQRMSDGCGMNFGRIAARLAVPLLAVAVPLPVATRGVGFSAVNEYSTICAMWSLEDISAIGTIFQYYRVALHLVYYKLSLARNEQFESVSFYSDPHGFLIHEEMRQILGFVRQVPISTYNIICSIGKIESSVIWHSVPFQGPPENGVQAALYLYPSNIRETLMLLADPNSDRNYRQQFHAHNPLPGARWEERANNGWILLNADQIWPANYDASALRADLHCYQNVLNRVALRGPVGFLKNFTWNGKACKSGTVSLDPAPLCLRATFVCGRPVAGQQQADPDPETAYQGDKIQGCTAVLIWSPDSDTTSSEMIAGAASLVGEHEGQPTRLQIQSRQQAHVSPTAILCAL